tara:strand:+ start:8357 stop:8911 length:555 start_codon:yes stop_codon:yes gene_type:complete
MELISRNKLNSVCVFCSTFNPENLFIDHVNQLVELLCENNIRVIYGGGNTGIMGQLATGIIKNGGNVTGVIPEFLYEKIQPLNDLSETIICKNMHERKMKMYNLSDAFIVLPGGIGTVDEMTEALTWSQLGLHNKRTIIANFENYWLPYLRLLEHLHTFKYLKDMSVVNYHIANNSKEIIDLLL